MVAFLPGSQIRSQSFPRSARLLTRREFDRVLRYGELRAVCDGLRLSARRNGGRGVRLGIVVPKRQVRRAVARNRIKRLIRESFRLRQWRRDGVDVVVGVRGDVQPMRNDEIFLALESLWRRLEKWRCARS
ncbi:ribonuclease P protein component [Halorhodospira abdelmalekii]|uniref:ribonuclease P protein component n=1 Tax=Halorhodospira abdelmalekii TaxID=421629 RepID=UPI0019070613